MNKWFFTIFALFHCSLSSATFHEGHYLLSSKTIENSAVGKGSPFMTYLKKEQDFFILRLLDGGRDQIKVFIIENKITLAGNLSSKSFTLRGTGQLNPDGTLSGTVTAVSGYGFPIYLKRTSQWHMRKATDAEIQTAAFRTLASSVTDVHWGPNVWQQESPSIADMDTPRKRRVITLASNYMNLPQQYILNLLTSGYVTPHGRYGMVLTEAGKAVITESYPPPPIDNTYKQWKTMAPFDIREMISEHSHQYKKYKQLQKSKDPADQAKLKKQQKRLEQWQFETRWYNNLPLYQAYGLLRYFWWAWLPTLILIIFLIRWGIRVKRRRRQLPPKK